MRPRAWPCQGSDISVWTLSESDLGMEKQVEDGRRSGDSGEPEVGGRGRGSNMCCEPSVEALFRMGGLTRGVGQVSLR